MRIVTPMDYLSYFRGKNVSVNTKGSQIVSGILESFDLNTNIGIRVDSQMEFVKGETVQFIALKPEEDTGFDASKLAHKKEVNPDLEYDDFDDEAAY